MASFCIMRTAKLRTDGNVAGSISHALRDRETPNADPNVENWTNLNVKGEDGKSHIPENAFDQAMARFRKTLPKKIGKGRVPCVELMMTVSPEVMTRPDFKSTSWKQITVKSSSRNFFPVTKKFRTDVIKRNS